MAPPTGAVPRTPVAAAEPGRAGWQERPGNRRVALLASASAVLLLGSACSSTSGDTSRPGARNSARTPAVSPSPSAGTSPASLADGCGIPGRDRLVGLAGNAAAPPALLLGHGTRGVVLSNQSDSTLCKWFPFARTLADRGYLVLLYGYPSGDAVADVRAAVATIRGAGARQVVLVGASKGAKASLLAAVELEPRVQGVVSLSAEESLRGRDVVGPTARLDLPLLVVTSNDDQYGSNLVAPRLMAAARSRDKRLLAVPGRDHGQDLLTGAAAGTVLPAVTGFLSRQER